MQSHKLLQLMQAAAASAAAAEHMLSLAHSSVARQRPTLIVLLLQLCSQEDDTAVELRVQLQGGLLQHIAEIWKDVLSYNILSG